MTRESNILSFDEAKAQGASRIRASHNHARSGSRVPTHTRSATASGVSSRGGRQAMGYFSEEEERRAEARAGASSEARRHARGAQDEKPSLLKKFRRKQRSAKADRQYDRTIGKHDADAARAQGQGGSRAALYEMKMGRDHRRSARMQTEGKSRASFGFSLDGVINALAGLANVTTARYVGIAACVLLAMGIFVWQPVADYYNEVRSLQQLQAQYDVVSEYYEQVKSEVDYLSTDEGMADYAHEQLGWVQPDEHSVNVEGLSSSAEDSDATSSTVQTLSLGATEVHAPDTWYSGVLDVVFGYDD